MTLDFTNADVLSIKNHKQKFKFTNVRLSNYVVAEASRNQTANYRDSFSWHSTLNNTKLNYPKGGFFKLRFNLKKNEQT